MSWFRDELLNRLPIVGFKSFDGAVLPPSRLRTGGRHFKKDPVYLESAGKEADRLTTHLGLTDTSRILDLGCGAGRLPIGLLSRRAKFASYHGIDVDAARIAWCKRHVASRDPRIEFQAIDVANERYNSAGAEPRPEELAFYSRTYDAIYLYSVISHMKTAEMNVYLAAFAHCLAPNGRIFISAFVEDGVEDCVENPVGYGPLKWEGPLHCVRFERAFFERQLATAGLAIDHFVHGKETDGQSAYYLKHASAAAE